MPSKVTDPALLAELNGDSGKVTDPELLAQLNDSGVAKGNGAQSGPAIPENTLGQEAKRQGLLMVRHLLNAAASPAVLIDKVQAKASDALTGKHIGGTLGEDLNARLTGLGLPEAERPIERFTQGMAESAPAFALPASLPAQVLGNAAISAAQAKPGEELEQAAGGAAAGAVPAAAGKVLKLAGKVAAPVLGMTTGAGSESIKQAARGTPEFAANMRGNVPASSVVEQARQALQTIRSNMGQRYATAKGGWAGDTTQLDLKPVAQAFDEATKKFSFQGTPQPGVAEVQQQVAQVLGHWNTQAQQNPAFLTVEGLDALKRHLQDLTPDFNNRTGRAFVTEVVNGVKDTITKQAPKYREAMEDYWRSSNELDEITKSLSLGDKASIDTALRKLQSLTRNNVSTNYGQRLVSAEALKQAGADVLPQVAGQAMNTFIPRGLQGAVAGGAGIPAALLSPKVLLAAPLASPRLVGEALHAGGKVATDPRTQAFIEALRRATPSAVRSIQE